MSTWNYRIVKIGNYYSLHEVFYNKKGQPCGMTNDPVDFGGNDPHELIQSLEAALKDAKTRPVFIYPKEGEWAEWDDKPDDRE